MKAADVGRSVRRVAWIRAVLILAFAVLAGRAAHLSVFDQRGADRGRAQALSTVTLAPARGSIVDRTGTSLALTVEAPSVYLVGREVKDRVAVARTLARVLGLDRARVLRSLEARSGFRFAKRWVSPEQAEQIREADLAGVGILFEPRRIYPHRGLAARLVGFANIDGDGVRGVEQQEDAWLRGTTRRVPVERDGIRNLLPVDGATTWGTAGGDVALTIDATLQADAQQALRRTVEETGARGGLVLAMDPHTGEILTLTEWPSFDPNRFRKTKYSATGSGAFLNAVEPGSAMKAFLVASALEEGVIHPDEWIDTEGGEFRVPGKTIRDARDFGPLSPQGVLQVSSNVGAVKIALEMGRRDHFEGLRGFGFGAATGSLFPDESAGVMRSWRNWKPVDHATIAFGQGVSVTPVQLATAASALANGGLLVRPRLVAARRVAGGAWQQTRPEVRHRAISRETARTVVDMLETVVSAEGTGRLAALAGVRVAGKTGTAQKWDAESGTYSQNAFRAWFVGMAPAEAPKVVIVAQLDEPKRPHHTGGGAAAPLFAKVAKAQLAHHGVFVEGEIHIARAPRPAPEVSDEGVPEPVVPDPTPIETPALKPRSEPAPQVARAPAPVAPTAPAVAAPPPAPAASDSPATEPAVRVTALNDRVLLPDLRGFTRHDVIQITAANGLQVTLEGDGLAVRQDPPPGSVVFAGRDTVRVVFSTGGQG